MKGRAPEGADAHPANFQRFLLSIRCVVYFSCPGKMKLLAAPERAFFIAPGALRLATTKLTRF